MLLTLNDDCLYFLCKQLDVEDHIMLSDTSKRLREIIARYYETHSEVTLGQKIWSNDGQELQEILATFGSNIGPHIKELSIEGMDAEQIKLLDKLPLKKITALELESEYGLEGSTRKQVHKYLSSLSAQLKKLSVCGRLFLWEICSYTFPNVTEFHVDDEKTRISDLEEMFPALTNLMLTGRRVDVRSLCELKNLTTLHLEYRYLTQEELQMIFDALPLKKLTIYSEDNEDLTLDGISKCQTLEELVYFLDCPLDELTKLKNLRKITFYGDIKPIFEHKNSVCKYLSLSEDKVLDFTNPNLAKKLKNLKHLKINLSSHKGAPSEKHSNATFEILMNAPNLHTFEFHGPESFAIQILEKMVQVCRDFYGERKEALSIFCCIKKEEALKEPQKFTNLSFPSFVKLSIKDFDGYNYEFPKIECDWQVNLG